MANFIQTLTMLASWLGKEHIRDYRETSTRIYELSVRTNTQINQIILTVSVASLAAIAALNKAVFLPYGLLAFVTISMFVGVIFLSVINLYLSILALADIRKKLSRNMTTFSRLNKDMEEYRFKRTQKILSTFVFAGFCLGLIALLVLLGFYILGTGV